MKIWGKNRLWMMLCLVILFGLGLMLLPAMASAVEVQFSIPEGSYDEPQTVVLTCDEGWKVCYTLDGTSPVIQGKNLTHPNWIGNANPVIISVDKPTQIRAVAYKYDPKYIYISDSIEDDSDIPLIIKKYSFSAEKTQNYLIGKTGILLGDIVFSIAEGNEEGTQELTLTSLNGWDICYTTDGSNPLHYSLPQMLAATRPIPQGLGWSNPVTIPLTKSCTIKAVTSQKKANTFAYILGNIQTYRYIPQGSARVGDINFMPAGGTFEDAIEVTLTCPDGWSICYTTDGSDPVDTKDKFNPFRGTQCTGPITISKATVLKAVAYHEEYEEGDIIYGSNGYSFSDIAEQTYHIIPVGSAQVGDINFMPAGGGFEDATEVTLTGPDGWSICYTTDGSDPIDPSIPFSPVKGTQYTGPITISEGTVLKAAAYKWNETNVTYTFSNIAEQTYHIIPAGSVQIGDINFLPAGGLIENPVEVTLSCPNGYSICYTTDGSDPVDHDFNEPVGTQYIEPITISRSTVLKAVAYQKKGAHYTFRPVAGQIYFFPDYTLTLTVPEFTPVFKGYSQSEAQPLIIESIGNSDATITSVSLSGSGADSFILNKTDGAVIQAEETDNTTYTIQPKAGLDRGFYSAKVTVAYDGGATAEADVTFTVNGMDAVSAPVISPATGNYQSLQWVTLTSATEGAYIYYTTDGTDPNSVGNGELYTGPIPVTADMTIKAIAVKAGMERSVITEAAYTIRLQVFYGENDLYLAQEHQQVICPFIPEKDGFYRFYCGDEEISTNIRVYDENGELVGAQLGEMRNNNWIAELEGGREYTVRVESLHGTGTVIVLVHSTMLYNIYADPDTTHGQVGISSGALAPENGSGGNIIGRTYAGAEVFFTGEPDNGYGLRSLEIVNAIGGALPQDPVFTMPFGTVTVRGIFDTLQTLSFEGDEHARFTNIWQDGGGMHVWEDVNDREVICGQLIQMNWECDEDWTADTITVTTAGGDPVDWTFGWDSGDRKVIQFEMPGENVHVAMTSRTFSFDSADFILPADTKSIEANAFQGDTHITAVVIPANCGSIGAGAFKDCTNLSYIRIPQGCTIGENAFEGCNWVRIYSSENSYAKTYCDTHDNCEWVLDSQN